MSTAVFPVWLSFWQSVSRRGYGVWSLVGRAVQSPSTDPVRSARGAFLLVLVQQGPDRHRCEGRAGPARRRATRRSRVGTPLPVPTGPVPKRSVPTRLRRVAHSNGRATRLGIRTAVNVGLRPRAAGQSVVAGLELRSGAPRAPVPPFNAVRFCCGASCGDGRRDERFSITPDGRRRGRSARRRGRGGCRGSPWRPPGRRCWRRRA